MFKKIPHTYVIVFGIILLAAILTWFIPGGEYARQSIMVNGVERTVIDKDSFQFTSKYLICGLSLSRIVPGRHIPQWIPAVLSHEAI